jgi:hypothetical protein
MLSALRTFRLLFDEVEFAEGQVDANVAVAFAMAQRQNHLIERRDLVAERGSSKEMPLQDCDLESLADLATSFVASVGNTFLDYRSVLRDGDRDQTDKKAIETFFVERDFESSEIEKRCQRYIESRKVDEDQRLASAYGARKLLEQRHSELSEKVFRDISCMSMDTATDIEEDLRRIVDSTVSDYLAHSLSVKDILRIDPSKFANPHTAEIIQVRADQLRRREGERRRRERRRAKSAMQPPASSASEENTSSLSSEAKSMSIRTKATSTSTRASEG